MPGKRTNWPNCNESMMRSNDFNQFFMSHSLILPDKPSYANTQDFQALEQLLFAIDTQSAVDTLRTLLRGWVCSECVQEKETDERSNLMFDYECLLAFLLAIEQNHR